MQKNLRRDAVEVQDPRAGGLELILGWATYIDFSNSRVLERLLIYERRIENSLDRTIQKLKKYQLMRQIQEAETRKAEPAQAIPSLRDEAATRPAEKEVDLKKQSQFPNGQNAAKSVLIMVYEALNKRMQRENKANSPISARKSEAGSSKS